MHATTIDYRNHHGAVEVNGLVNAEAYHNAVDHSQSYALSDRRVVRIVRLRLLTDPGFPFYDLSYCHGELADGTVVPVNLDRYQFAKSGLNGQLIDLCKRAGRYGKQLGIFDAVSYVS